MDLIERLFMKAAFLLFKKTKLVVKLPPLHTESRQGEIRRGRGWF
jgi:hypothetical protein